MHLTFARIVTEDDPKIRRAEFRERLTAHAARRAEMLVNPIFVAPDHGDRFKIRFALADRFKQRHALGADGRGKALVFNITAEIDPAPAFSKRRAHLKARIRRVGVCLRVQRTDDQFLRRHCHHSFGF